jgi:hypothetical protein
MKKLWEAFWAVAALLIVVMVAIAAVKPYLPLLGIAIFILILVFVGIMLWRVFFRRSY